METHAPAILAAAVRSLIDSGAFVLPPGITKEAVQVTPVASDPPRLELAFDGRTRAFPIVPSADDALRGLPDILALEAQRAVVHLNEILEDEQESHLQW